MTEWSRDPNLPMANVPSRVAQLVIDAKMWADKTFK
jgi:thiosulfate/3-mercaptopyruvate sulfurtransferase